MPEMMLPPPEAIKIDENTYRIEQGFVRFFLFIGGESALLLDAGFGGEKSLKELIGTLTDKPVRLVLTHTDPDHIGYLSEFDAAYLLPEEIPVLEAMPGGVKSELRILSEGDVIDIGGRSFEVLKVPGHTPGSLALLDRAGRILITGDLVSTLPIFLFGPGRDFDAYVATMERLSGMESEFDLIYPSHGIFPLTPDYIDKLIAAAKKLRAGELPPLDPPMPIPAKMYMDGDVGFYI